jgi:sensor histidine kinase YesM
MEDRIEGFGRRPASARYVMISDIIKYGIIIIGGVYALGQVSGKVDNGFDQMQQQIQELKDTVRQSQQDERSDIKGLSQRIDSIFERPK